MSKDPQRLERAFRALGLDGEELQASIAAEVEGDRPALARNLFLTAAWQHVVDERTVGEEPAWIEAWLRNARRRDVRQRGVGATLERVLDAGVEPSDLTEIVRTMQRELLFALTALLDCEDLGSFESALPKELHVAWRLFETDPQGRPTRRIESLQESVEAHDPLPS